MSHSIFYVARNLDSNCVWNSPYLRMWTSHSCPKVSPRWCRSPAYLVRCFFRALRACLLEVSHSRYGLPHWQPWSRNLEWHRTKLGLLRSVVIASWVAYISKVTVGIGVWISDLCRDSNVTPRRGLTASVPQWSHLIYKMTSLKPKTQSCLEGQWVEAWRKRLLVLQVEGWFEAATQSEKWVK